MTPATPLLASGATLLALLLPVAASADAPTYTCDGHRATIVGTAEDDHLTGTAGPDVIVALGGDDRIEAGAGDDVVCGLAGADRIDAGPGDDRIFGGIDSAWSDRGGANRVGDRILPGPGRDYVDLGSDRRPATGTLVRDTLDYSDLGHAVQADLTPEIGRVAAEGTDTVRVHGQMGVVGTAYDDTITGSPKADTLRGLGGDDHLEGRGGNDLLLPGGGADAADGDFGNDVINSWGGADVLRGGPGNDFVDTQSNPDVATVSLGPGGDQLNTDVRPRGGFDADAGTGRDTIVLGYTRHHDLPAADLDLVSGTVTLGASATGRLASFEWWVMLDDQPLTIHGTDASERIEAGGHGPVRAWMAGGNDAVFASGSDDFVDSGPGNDLVWAYRGTDTCLNTERARDCEIRQAPPAPAARPPVVTCAGRPATIVGTSGRDHLRGTPGDDVIAGLGGDDRLDGLAGDDVLCGGPGEDELTSYEQGRDVLVGGLGDDFVGSFENPYAVVRLGPGDDYASSQIGRGTGWSLDAGPGHDSVYLHLTRALYDAGSKPGSADLRAGTLKVGAATSGRFASWEDLDLPSTVRWRVEGTAADERYYFEGILGVRVHARAGDDTIFGTIGADTILAGAGVDTVTTYGGQDVCRDAEHTRGCDVRERAGLPAAYTCHGRSATIVGTNRDDHLVGTAGPDVIVGRGGRDAIEGGPGDDVICAGLDGGYTGSSPGGAEYDVVIGDQVTGGPGDDLIDLGFDPKQLKLDSDGPDRLLLGPTTDAKTVHLAADGAWGSAVGDGRDRILGQRLLEVRGSPGPDTIWGSPFADLIDGRGGDDVIHGLGGVDELFDGGTRQWPDLDVLDGGAGGDVLFSSAGVDLLQGGPGQDELSAYATGSTMSGGAGDDYLIYGRAGTGCPDTLGGGGRDTLALRPSYAARHARIAVGLDGGSLGPCGSVREVEKLFLDYGFGDDIGPMWVVSGTDRGDWVRVFMIGRLTAHLRGGDDTMIGADRDDVMDGGPGDDTAFGNGGHDTCPRVEHARSC